MANKSFGIFDIRNHVGQLVGSKLQDMTIKYVGQDQSVIYETEYLVDKAVYQELFNLLNWIDLEGESVKKHYWNDLAKASSLKNIKQGNSSMWQKLESRGRLEFRIDDTWEMYSADLRQDDNVAELKFAKKSNGKWVTGDDIVGLVKYMDLR